MTDDNIQKAARTARSAIADLVEAARDEKRVDGQGVRYWAEVAAHSIARNDTLISQLKEKEKIAADLEQQLNSADIAAKSTVDLKSELERVHAAAAEWERKFNGLQANYKEDEEVYSRTREENQKLVQALREKDAQIAEMAKAITPVAGKQEPMGYVLQKPDGVRYINEAHFDRLKERAIRDGANYCVTVRGKTTIFEYL